MAYLPNIPQPTDFQDASQPQLLENFTQLNNIFGIDHATFNAASNNGKHNKVTFPNQTVAPVAAGTDVILYNLLDPNTTRQEVYFTSATGPTYPITGGLRNVNGWSRIGGGIYLIWGTQTSDNNTTNDTTINLSHSPASGTILSAQCTEFPTSVSGTDNNYVLQVTAMAGSVTVGVFTRATASATRLASKRFTFLVMRL